MWNHHCIMVKKKANGGSKSWAGGMKSRGDKAAASEAKTRGKERVDLVASSVECVDNGYTFCGYKLSQRKSLTLVIFIALMCGIIHRQHVAFMFESDRHFSHLSELEREMCFRTEMGLYYTYYKSIVKADSLSQGLNQIMNDNRTEYPNTINTLKRFNLYPEVVIGSFYRFLTMLAGKLHIESKTCWSTNRGDNLPPIISCEGWGDREYFYINCVFFTAGITVASLFILATMLSGDILGGIISALCFLYNHSECTRVQWTPPLRESFGYPLCIVEMLVVTWTIRHRSPTIKVHSVLIGLCTMCFMSSWQFGQFMLSTQILALSGTYILGLIQRRLYLIILAGQALGLAGSYVILFGNEMLLTSLLAGSLCSALLLSLLETTFYFIPLHVLRVVFQGTFVLVNTIFMKYVLAIVLRIKDDAHIFSILKSKFTSYSDFHTKLYTCAAEFDFLNVATYIKLCRTLVLPAAVFVTLVIVTVAVKQQIKRCLDGGLRCSSKECHKDSISGQHRSTKYHYRHADLVYHVFQLAAFTIMAVTIMRLKLFWTPHLCLMCSMLASRTLITDLLGLSRVKHYTILALILALMTVEGWQNIQDQRAIVGEYSNIKLEELITWINNNTPKDAVFAGAMPTMANIHLSTDRPIVDHPHYEDSQQRERTKRIYWLFSRKPVTEVHKMLTSEHVDYAVLERNWCAPNSRDPAKAQCTLVAMWDAEDIVNRGKQPFCFQARSNAKPYFNNVYDNDEYAVLRVNTLT